MDATDFVNFIATVSYRSAITSTYEALESPRGRRPPSDLKRASAWFARLSEADRAIVRWVITDAAHAATFGVLAVIDGVRHTGPHRYELVAVADDGTRTVVNPEASDDLHQVFQGLAMRSDGTLVE